MTVHRSELQPVSKSWCRGFRPIYQKELAYWLGGQRWIRQLILWLSLTTVPAIWMTPNHAADRGISYLTLFLWLAGSLISIGTILLAQSAIIEEKTTQTLLWIYSKPLSSTGLILAKFSAYAVLVGVVALSIPAIVTGIAAVIVGLSSQISLLNYIAGVSIVYVMLLFFLALTLMLGTVFERVGLLIAIALFILFGGASLNSDPTLRQIEPYTMWALPRYSTQLVIGQIPSQTAIAIGITIVFTILCLLVAIWRMQRYEM